MPFLSLLLLLPLLTLGQGKDPITEITFTTGTRGSQLVMRLTPDSLQLQKRGMQGNTDLQHPLSPADWQQLLSSLQGLSLEELEQLPAPSEKRAYDGAPYSWITISTGNKTYTSQHFDGRSPHKKLLPLMQEISRLEQQHSEEQ